jgi:cobalt-zinc-cadmium efflux system membrane fusion protein
MRFLRFIMIAAAAGWLVLAGANIAGTDENEGAGHGTAQLHEDHSDRQQHGDHEAGQVEAEEHNAEAGEVADAHEGHDHGEDAHEGEQAVRVSADAIRHAGIEIKTAQSRNLTRSIELPGEIGFNEDRLVHVTPRFPGVAREVHAHIGEYVKEGDVLVVLESNESLSRYSIPAPISGRIIEKHVAAGEFVAEDSDLYLIADLSTVWVNCEVYAKDMPDLRQGMRMTVSAVEGGQSVDATLSYIAPVYSEHTRSALARAVLANNGDLWRPGTFIRAMVPVEMGDARLTVETGAVQILGEEQVVFVPGEHEGEFEVIPVHTGLRGEHVVEILSGLNLGDAYVAAGAFELKAKTVTANLGAHAGHGH